MYTYFEVIVFKCKYVLVCYMHVCICGGQKLISCALFIALHFFLETESVIEPGAQCLDGQVGRYVSEIL